MATASKKLPLPCLPLPPTSHLLIHNLTPDPRTPSVPAFREFLASTPSLQRRARLLAAPAHFSHVSPLPIAFPFDIEPPAADSEQAGMDREEYIEWWLAQREAIHPRPIAESPGKEGGKEGEGEQKTYEVLYPRDPPQDEPVLLALSDTGLRDMLPHLDAADALALLGPGSLSPPKSEKERKPDVPSPAARTLIDVLAGRALLLAPEGAPVPFAPWALRYSGHQFGQWAGQLGDGRAITILATPNPRDPGAITEVQLKGAGRTPFSRSADGLAVVRSSIREYLCAEAMYALGIPTTRSLSLVGLPGVPVLRERTEKACVTARLAPSFLRIGSFEALNAPARLFFFGGGQQEADLEALRALGEFVATRVLKVKREGEGVEGKEEGGWARKIVLECARRNAEMVAGWQAYGFMHGVINTDNVSILGLTIDYGPYAFMDVFDELHICNHTDSEGRYAYKHQPAMILFALSQLLRSLAPLIGFQSSSQTPLSAGWANDATEEQIEAWTKAGLEATQSEMNTLFRETFDAKYADLMRARLGLAQTRADDVPLLVTPLLALLADQRLDFHGVFRVLAAFKPSLLGPESSEELEKFVGKLLALSGQPDWVDRFAATRAWIGWLEGFATRIREERGEGFDEAARCAEARARNPRFVLRQWVLEEIIKRVEEEPVGGRRVLSKVMQMACSPFEPWGGEEDTRPEDQLDPEVREERRMCGLGASDMLGFQCSCSS